MNAIAPLRIYLAGPDVFLPDARRIGQEKQRICRAFGFEGLFPLDNEQPAGADPEKIFQANCSLMRRADVGLFNLTPFRGPSADAGTVFELGFLFASGKPVYGYTAAVKTYRDRVGAIGDLYHDQAGQPRDSDGYAVENFELQDNLMIVHAIQESGGALVAREEGSEKGGAYLAAFSAFKACLEIAGRRLRHADIRRP